jgi:HlyD family secretion protein
LREDMTLSIEVETARRDKAISVPVSALRSAADPQGQAVVHVVRDGRLEARKVRTGLRTLEAVEILEGLTAGEVVALDPEGSVGSRVRADTRAARRASGSPADSAAATMTGTMGR